MPSAVIIGAGPGLGLSMARRLGRENYDVALVSRNPGRHAPYLEELKAAGIKAAAFAADVRDPRALGEALDAAERAFGPADFVYYGPSPHQASERAAPVTEITGTEVADAMGSVYPAVDVVAKVLPGMRERGTGTLLFASAISALLPVPELGAMAVPAAASRGYAVTLHAALAKEGVFAGALVIGGLIRNSDIHGAMAEAGAADAKFLLDPDRIADIAWEFARARKSPEVVVLPGRKGLGINALLTGRLWRAPKKSARAAKAA
ncbi:SDR family NAD(P)-dependent oxidoreductase [Streptomyces sp. P6-2-1]|uniref:SDR family NAD(P)-dependent oxidoreductase n=1 Tax=Streptomyces sp. P6-2-1 TaxID=3422591 RepID=UPI003D36A8E8